MAIYRLARREPLRGSENVNLYETDTSTTLNPVRPQRRMAPRFGLSPFRLADVWSRVRMLSSAFSSAR